MEYVTQCENSIHLVVDDGREAEVVKYLSTVSPHIH